jgi:RP/EB family microtubule-associated protein
MTASRTDLLAWLNDLLQINYTKVEQCGSGGAYCQILDSVYGVWIYSQNVCLLHLLTVRQATYQ